MLAAHFAPRTHACPAAECCNGNVEAFSGRLEDEFEAFAWRAETDSDDDSGDDGVCFTIRSAIPLRTCLTVSSPISDAKILTLLLQYASTCTQFGSSTALAARALHTCVTSSIFAHLIATSQR